MIQHKLDLYAAGLEYNSIVGVDLAESRRAFDQYLSNLDSLSFVEKRTVNDLQAPEDCKVSMTASGVHAVVDASVRLFTLGSALRGIPYKEWEIPFPITSGNNYSFFPDAGIIALVGWQTHGRFRALSVYCEPP